MDLDNLVLGASPVRESTDVVGASSIGKSTNMSCDTPLQDISLDMTGTLNFQSNNDGNEDQSSTGGNDFFPEEEAWLDNDSSCKETMKASLIGEEELKKAVEYVNQFKQLDLNPNKDPIDNADEDDMPTTFDIDDQRQCTFRDFGFLTLEQMQTRSCIEVQ